MGEMVLGRMKVTEWNALTPIILGLVLHGCSPAAPPSEVAASQCRASCPCVALCVAVPWLPHTSGGCISALGMPSPCGCYSSCGGEKLFTISIWDAVYGAGAKGTFFVFWAQFIPNRTTAWELKKPEASFPSFCESRAVGRN